MKLSELLPAYLPQYAFSLQNEQEFEALGLIISPLETPFCTFVDGEKSIKDVSDHVSMVITTEELAPKLLTEDRGVCIVDAPRIVYFRLHNVLSAQELYARKKEKTVVGANCMIHPTAIIADSNVVIGDNVIIEEYAVIRENVTIGDNTIIRAGVKLGFPDFEFKKEDGKLFGVEHCGGVVIGKEVEILPNTCINKALYPWDDTVVGDYCKIDMLVQISHAVKIGAGSMIVGLSGIGGRTEIGKNCWVGYGCTVRNGIHVGDNSRINMGAVVSRDVEDGQAVTGNFAIDHEVFMKNLKKSIKG